MERDPLFKRRGRVTIDARLVCSNPGQISKLFEGCVITRCEMRFDPYCFDYEVVSPQFGEIPDDHYSPRYDITKHFIHYSGPTASKRVLDHLSFAPDGQGREDTLHVDL